MAALARHSCPCIGLHTPGIFITPGSLSLLLFEDAEEVKVLWVLLPAGASWNWKCPSPSSSGSDSVFEGTESSPQLRRVRSTCCVAFFLHSLIVFASLFASPLELAGGF